MIGWGFIFIVLRVGYMLRESSRILPLVDSCEHTWSELLETESATELTLMQGYTLDIYIHICKYACIHICVCVYIYKCIYTYMHIFMYTIIRIYKHIYRYTYFNMFIYTYIYTYIYIYIQ